MRRLLVALLVLALTIPAGSALATVDHASSAARVETEGPPRKKRVQQRASEWIRMYAKVGLRRHRLTDVEYTSSQRWPGRPVTTGDAERGISWTCVKRRGGSRVIAFPKRDIAMAGTSFTHKWTLHTYKVNRARRVWIGGRKRWMKQFEHCVTGGGHSWNKWNVNFEGAAISLKDRPDIKLAGRWGEKVADDGGIHSTLGFELSAGIAKIGATTPVGIDDDLRFTGTHGWDPRIYLPAEYVDANEVNAYYDAADNWTFQGTDREVGNNLHVLYEVPQRARGALAVVVGTKISAHCTKWFQVLGRRCESFG